MAGRRTLKYLISFYSEICINFGAIIVDDPDPPFNVSNDELSNL